MLGGGGGSREDSFARGEGKLGVCSGVLLLAYFTVGPHLLSQLFFLALGLMWCCTVYQEMGRGED